MDFELIIKIIGAGATLWGGITILYKKVLLPGYKQKMLARQQRHESAEQMRLAISKLEGVITTVDLIKKQVMPNGGSSLADSLKRVENKFKQFDAKFDNMQEENKIFYNMQGKAFWVSDNEGQTVYVSPNLCKMIERSESELLGNQWLSCLIKADEKRISEEWKKSVAEKRPFDEIYSFKGDDGNIVVHAIAFHKKDKENIYTGSIGELSLNVL